MNRLVYFCFCNDNQDKIKRRKYNAWIFECSIKREFDENENHGMREFREKCESAGFQIIGESLLICNEANAQHFLNSFITRIPSIDCIIVPDIHSVAANIQSAFETVESLQTQGIAVFCFVNGEMIKLSSTLSILQAFSMSS